MRRGFTLMEMLVVIGIVGILAAIALSGSWQSKKEKEVRVIADGIVFALEEAKANALAGKYGTNHGVSFDTTQYTLFSGSSFDPAGEHNRERDIDPQYAITTTFGGQYEAVVFARVTGEAAPAGSITITDTDDATNTRTISVGAEGDITMVE